MISSRIKFHSHAEELWNRDPNVKQSTSVLPSVVGELHTSTDTTTVGLDREWSPAVRELGA